jgi:plastocyanin
VTINPGDTVVFEMWRSQRTHPATFDGIDFRHLLD